MSLHKNIASINSVSIGTDDYSLSIQIIAYIQTHAKLPRFRVRSGHDLSWKHPHGTFRDTKSHTFEWRSKIKPEVLNQTQELCTLGMNRMGYKVVSTRRALHNPRVNLIDQIY